MANRRMFSKDIVDSDKFLDMPPTAQNLYFHLGVHADDDGFVSSPKKVQRSATASNDDLTTLVNKAFIIPFETGVVVITDWHLNNQIRKDRYKETIYQEEKQNLFLMDNQKYQYIGVLPEVDNQAETKWQPKGDQMETQYSIGKYSLVEDSKNNRSSTQALKDRFESIWKVYPLKKGKDKAFKSYQKAIKEGATDEEILQGINAYNAEIAFKRTEKQYIMHGSTWFNQKRWTDDYEVGVQPKQVEGVQWDGDKVQF